MLPDEGIYSYSAVLMGSPILLKLFEHNHALASHVFRLIKQQENLLTVNRAHSEVMSINQAAGDRPVVVSQAVYALITLGKAASVLPDSLFNVAIGPLVKCWKIGFNGNSVPPLTDIQALLALTDPHDVVLNDEDCSVFLQKSGMELDLGAIAKGYIADLVRDYLRQKGVENALINLGGNVQTQGGAVDSEGGSWGIGLKKPYAGPDELIGVIHIRGKSVVTSGVYERYFEQAGKRYHHILDPHSGYPLNNELLSVTVVCQHSIEGDIYSTLLYGMGVEKGLAYLATRPDIDAIFVTRDRQIICSSARQFTFRLLDEDFDLLYATDKTA